MPRIILDEDLVEQVSVSEVVGYYTLYVCYISFRTQFHALFELRKLEDGIYFVMEADSNNLKYKAETVKECIVKAIKDNQKVCFFRDQMDYLKNR